MSGNSQQRRKALRAAQRNGTPVHKPKREIVEPEPRGEAEWVAYLERSLLNDTMWARSKDPIWIQAFEEHGVYGKPGGCARCYGKVLQWYKAGKPLRQPQSHKEIAEAVIAEACVPNSDSSYADTPPFLRNLEKRSWLNRLLSFFKRMWRAGK